MRLLKNVRPDEVAYLMRRHPPVAILSKADFEAAVPPKDRGAYGITLPPGRILINRSKNDDPQWMAGVLSHETKHLQHGDSSSPEFIPPERNREGGLSEEDIYHLHGFETFELLGGSLGMESQIDVVTSELQKVWILLTVETALLASLTCAFAARSRMVREWISRIFGPL